MVKPILQALLLADYVYEDRRTGKKVVAGIFSALGVVKGQQQEEESTLEEPGAGHPQEHKLKVSGVERAGSPYVYISLTELHGATELRLRYVSLDASLESREALFETSPFSVVARSPVDSVEIVLPVPPLPRIPGVYALELLFGDELLGAHRVTVQQIEQAR